jgi:hypothetical protein
MDILALFVDVDDFCRAFHSRGRQPRLAVGATRNRPGRLALSEVLAIVIAFHASHYRTFKHYYREHVGRQLRAEFPGLPSYSRFVELIPTTLLPLASYLHTRYGQPTGIAFVDSTPIAVCHNRRIPQHKVFAG